MPRGDLPPPHSLTAGSVPLVPRLFCGFDVYSGIMGDIPAARFRERLMRESHEAPEAGEYKDHSLIWISAPPYT